MTEQPKPWTGLGYEQVPGLANRFISRYLRTQRRNMTRFFTERGMWELAERLQMIRKSRQGMLAKNRMFRSVLDDYAKLVMPPRAAPGSADEANHQQGEGPAAVEVPVDVEAMGSIHADSSGPGSDAAAGVSGLANPADAGPVIEE